MSAALPLYTRLISVADSILSRATAVPTSMHAELQDALILAKQAPQTRRGGQPARSIRVFELAELVREIRDLGLIDQCKVTPAAEAASVVNWRLLRSHVDSVLTEVDRLVSPDPRPQLDRIKECIEDAAECWSTAKESGELDEWLEKDEEQTIRLLDGISKADSALESMYDKPGHRP